MRVRGLEGEVARGQVELEPRLSLRVARAAGGLQRSGRRPHESVQLGRELSRLKAVLHEDDRLHLQLGVRAARLGIEGPLRVPHDPALGFGGDQVEGEVVLARLEAALQHHRRHAARLAGVPQLAHAELSLETPGKLELPVQLEAARREAERGRAQLASAHL